MEPARLPVIAHAEAASPSRRQIHSNLTEAKLLTELPADSPPILAFSQSAPLIVVVGPTAVGKSSLALRLAREMGGEIVSADSRQVYRLMNIGTAKPTVEEQAAVRHHLINLVDPDGEYTLAHYQADAYRAIANILARGRLPLLVGGTGLYIRAVVEGTQIPSVAPDQALRSQLEARAAKEGGESLVSELAALDPESASRIDPRNLRRLIRAIEVCRTTGQPFSAHAAPEPPPYRILTIGLTNARSTLYKKIDERVDEQLAAGLVSENERLLALGYDYHLPSMSGLGYRQIGEYLRGRLSLERATEVLKFDTHHFARRQYAWFRPADPAIRWLTNGPGAFDDACRLIEAHVVQSTVVA